MNTKVKIKEAIEALMVNKFEVDFTETHNSLRTVITKKSDNKAAEIFCKATVIFKAYEETHDILLLNIHRFGTLEDYFKTLD